MLFTLAALVFFAAIMTFFSQEFIKLFKKIMAIKGAKIILPLILASSFVVICNEVVAMFFFYYRIIIQKIVYLLMFILPFGQISSHIAYIITLSFLSLVPVFAFDYLIHRKKSYQKYNHPYWASSFIWVITLITLLMF